MKHLLFLSLLALAACGPSYEYEQEYELSEQGWAYQDSLDFSFAISDTATIYNLWLSVTHSPEYSYQNLYTRIHTTFPDGSRLSEVLSLELMPTEAGRWQGNCSSTSCHLQIPIQEGAYFDQAGDYTITIEQHMRESPVAGVQGLAFMLEDTGQRR